MFRSGRLTCGILALFPALAPLRAHEEWNNLHIVYSARTNYVYPFDGRSPKIAVALLNHYDTTSPAVAVTLSVNDQRPDAGGFTLFPDGGSGDSQLRKLRVSDGAILWRALAGGWPNVNGLDLTPDGGWLAAGTKSLDTTVIRTSDGRVEWQAEAQFGVTTALADPQLTLFRDTTPVAANDNWYEAPNAVAIAASAFQVGAFALPPPSRDAALMLSLPPGSYTVQVSGVGGTTGNALVEVYEVP